MFPTDSYPLARRDILTLAGLASISPFSIAAAQVATPMPTAQAAAARRRELYALLGDLPARNRPIAGKKRGEEEREGYLLETWDLDLNGVETVPAYLARPKGATGRRPAVLFNHSHGGGYKIGKQEFIEGRSYLQPVPYARELTGARLRRALDRSLGLRRAQPHHRAGHVQGHALAGAGAVGNDGLRQHPRARLPAGAPRRRHGSASPRSASRWAAPWRGGSRRSTSASR